MEWMFFHLPMRFPQSQNQKYKQWQNRWSACSHFKIRRTKQINCIHFNSKNFLLFVNEFEMQSVGRLCIRLHKILWYTYDPLTKWNDKNTSIYHHHWWTWGQNAIACFVGIVTIKTAANIILSADNCWRISLEQMTFVDAVEAWFKVH